MYQTHEEKLDTIKAHPRGAHHLVAALAQHWQTNEEELAKGELSDKGIAYTRGERYAVGAIIDAAHRSAMADALPVAAAPDKLAGMLDTILAEVEAARHSLAGYECARYALAKLQNAGKLAALARGVHLQSRAPATPPVETPARLAAVLVNLSAVARGLRDVSAEIKNMGRTPGAFLVSWAEQLDGIHSALPRLFLASNCSTSELQEPRPVSRCEGCSVPLEDDAFVRTLDDVLLCKACADGLRAAEKKPTSPTLRVPGEIISVLSAA